MALRFTSGDASGFKFLLFLVVIYGLIALLVHSILHMRFITPLEIDAPLDRFSEARAVQHVRVLAQDISSRQVSSLAKFSTPVFRIFCVLHLNSWLNFMISQYNLMLL
jgi:hypothetical protein